MARSKMERVASIEEQIAQLENKKNELLEAHKEKERKARTHRICERGGHIESILPDTVSLSFAQFKIFMEKTLMTPYAKKILKELLPTESIEQPAIGDTAATPADIEVTPKPIVVAVQAGGTDSAKTADTEVPQAS